jgi:monoamine oxidase
VHERKGRRRIGGRRGWQQLAIALRPQVRTLVLNDQRWDGPIAETLGRQSVADWLDQINAPLAIKEVSIGLRGFFLADPDQLSLLALADQFADEGTPGEEAMFRISGGNDRLPAVLAKRLGNRLRLSTVLRRIRQTRKGVTLGVETDGRRWELRTDYLISTLPAPTLCHVIFEPELPEEQRNTLANLKYGPATKTAIQFSEAPWRIRGKPRAFGTPLPIGAVWDGNEEQPGRPGILTLLAGGRASEATRHLLSHLGPEGIVRELTWLDFKKTKILASTSVSWEHEPWSRGGYAYFDTAFSPTSRAWLSRPFRRVFFAGEHTSIRWQGYMNGAVESGLRAAEEVALASGREDPHF